MPETAPIHPAAAARRAIEKLNAVDRAEAFRIAAADAGNGWAATEPDERVIAACAAARSIGLTR